ncbi:hypothetical protein PT974_05815 [Cladobotryum mycophilum]|uniref:Membrane anchor Opy2 N-terminal domain-containing protein n=1 Tax=Cladobotryum mycophilum TaxID=491253 RepID=A0ABR0SJU0_9HYPO
MKRTPYLVARDMTELHEIPRVPACVKCDDQSKLQCPSCNTGESCQFTVPLDCSQCPKSFCMKDSSPSNSGGGSGGSGPSAGPIAGGVVGGIFAIAIITYLVWRFLIKPKRSRISQAVFEAQEGGRRGEKDGASRMTRRSSTHTVHSIASTVLTRASNIIQIAYIPGVTNRATPSPNVLVPPVPPIPMHHTLTVQNDQHFFVPGDLRDSTYSGISGYSDRTSYARTSFAPRSSIASTIYGKQAQVLAPAQTGMRAKPTVVSVKPGSSGGSVPNTPPVPSIDFEKYTLRPKSAASNFSVGSTFLNNANTATQARAQVVKVAGSGLKKVELGSNPGANVSSTTLGIQTANIPAPTSNLSKSDQGPFSDPPAGASPQTPTTTSKPGPVDDGAEKDGRSERGSSPFGDEHATKD